MSLPRTAGKWRIKAEDDGVRVSAGAFMNLNFIMAICWLIAAAGLFVWNAQNPERALVIRRTDVSLGWLAAVVAAYNLARWWSTRLNAKARREETANRERRRHED